jgi:hypothetical protein
MYSPEKNQDVHDLTAEAVQFAAENPVVTPEAFPAGNTRETPRFSKAAIERAQQGASGPERKNTENTPNVLNQVTKISLLLAMLRKNSNISRGSV